MKKLLLVIILALGAWVGFNYYRSGEISLFPVELTAEQRELRDLEAELKSIDEQIAQETRSAGLTGMDTTMAVSRLMERKKKIEERIDELRGR